MDPLFHFIFPVLILLALKIEPRKVLLLSPFTLLPDLDALIPPHRAVLHNLVICLIIPMIFIFYSYYRKKEYLGHFLIIQFFLISHLVLDIDAGGVALFYPFSDDAYHLSVSLVMSSESGGQSLKWVVEYGVHDKPTPLEEVDVDAFSSLVFVMILVIIIAMTHFPDETRKFIDELKLKNLKEKNFFKFKKKNKP
jgi:membrane-bound metal-dependent hydrolase YbcI (DUF457 family)